MFSEGGDVGVQNEDAEFRGCPGEIFFDVLLEIDDEC